MAINKVGVIGGGLMGSGIAQTAAQAGYDVALAEVNQELLERGMKRIHGAWEMLQGKGKITADQVTEYRGRIHGTLDLREFGDSDLVIEA
ncbi:MAG: 3-hydroxyacyl-CoA dehydrogenase NAD-binding domain-containing protein, partial [Ktedonobacterales bacterium]